jgi:hypothetical protein
MADVELVAEGCSPGRHELGPSVRSDNSWYSKAGNPVSKQGSSAVCGGDGGKGDCLGHLAVLSITVKRYVWPCEGGSSPTKSNCMSEAVIDSQCSSRVQLAMMWLSSK